MNARDMPADRNKEHDSCDNEEFIAMVLRERYAFSKMMLK